MPTPGVNRLYSACFYAVSALLLTKGLTATRHSSLRTLFHQHLIRPGLLPLGQGQLYDRLFDQRQRSDYADLVHFGFTRSESGMWRRRPSSMLSLC